jgi:uncharacterized OB-fold protein
LSTARYDLPLPDDETRPYWDAARGGKLLIKRCNACNEPFFYPRPFCPRCWSDDVVWEESSGRATLYTWSVVRQNDLPPWPARVPYVAAVVDLDEGPRMLTNIEDCDVDALTVGMKVEVAFREENDEITVPVFRPVPA